MANSGALGEITSLGTSDLGYENSALVILVSINCDEFSLHPRSV